MKAEKKAAKPYTAKPYTYERSWNYVLWLLGRKAYTQKQLKDKLKQKDAEPEVIERVMKRLNELKFVDDKAYAEMYVRSRQHKKGSIALKQELFQKGISETLVTETLEPLDQAKQKTAAKQILEKNQWRLTKTEEKKRYSKAYAFLARRGFPSDVVREALSGFFDEFEESFKD